MLSLEIASQRPWHLGGEIRYRVEVPAGVDIRASAGAGAVGVEGTSGEVDLTTGAGMVRFANLSGRVRATTDAGKVQGTDLTSREVEARTNAGAVSLAFDQPPDRVDAQTNAGSVDLLVPDDRYAVSATAYAGEAIVDVQNDPAAPRRLVVQSNAGRVRVRRRPG